VEEIKLAWEQQADEPAKAYAAFCIYRDLGPAGRSLDKAYRVHTGRPDGSANGSWGTWSREFQWTGRAKAYDDYNDVREREAYEAELRKVATGRGRIDGSALETYERTLELARKKLEYFYTLPAEDIPLTEVLRLARILAASIPETGTAQQTMIREYVGVDVDGV
jgi:hypothetical protein